MNRMKQGLEGSIQLILTGLAKTHGYTVEFGPYQTASINFQDKKFRFPYLPLEVTAVDKERLYGYMWHEMSHFKYTTAEDLKELNPKANGFWNSLEDPFMESLHNQQSNFAKKRMERLNDILINEDKVWEPTKVGDKPLNIFRGFLLSYGYSEIAKHEICDELAVNDAKVFKDTFGKPLFVKVKNLIKGMVNMTGTLDVVHLANHLYDLVEQEKDEQEQKNAPPSPSGSETQSGDSSNQNNGQSSSDQEDESNEEQSNSPDSNNSQCDSPDSNSGQCDSSGLANSNSQDETAGGTGQTEGVNQKVINALTELLGDKDLMDMEDLHASMVSENISSNSMQTPKNPTFDYERPRNSNLNSFGNLNPYKKLPSLALQVKRSFQSKNRRRVTRTEHGALLHHTFPISLAVNDPRIFRKKSETKAVNTHVAIAWDLSGSMNGSRFSLSKESIVSMVDAFEKTRGLTSSVCGFPNPHNDSENVHVLKMEGQRLETVRGNFLLSPDGGHTPTAPAQYWCFEQCMWSNSPRQIIIIITDGHPNSYADQIPVINRLCERAGIEVYALGLECKAVDNFWNNSMVINKLSELPHQMERIINQR